MLTSCPYILQICDKEWHYYVINVEFPAVTLFVDGVTYEPYLVTDDWPIHPSSIDTQLTVGACWQGHYRLLYRVRCPYQLFVTLRLS